MQADSAQPEPAAAAPRTEQHLSLDQARLLAAHALDTGRPALAVDVTQGLLAANSKDSMAWYLQAAAQAQLRSPDAARRAAARSYRTAADQAGKFRAAQLAAQQALAAERPTLAQIWLRRTAIHAPSAQSEIRIAEDYDRLRQINPWRFRLRSELRPSNNVNNGADSTLEVIDGVPTLGRFGPRSVALAGIVGVIDTTLTRRLQQSARRLTTLSGRAYVQRVALSSSAQAEAAALAEQSNTSVPRNSEFGSTYGDLTLNHAFAVGPAERRGSAAVGLTLGTAWYGGEKSYDLVRVSARRSWQLSSQLGLTISGSAEERLDPRSSSQDGQVFGLGLHLRRDLNNGNQMDISLALRDAQAGHVNGTSTTTTLQLTYQFSERIGPARISTGLILGQADYPQYIAGFPARFLADGRKDQSIYADINLLFEAYDYAGFAPNLRLRAGKRDSNHNRFESRDISLSLGIESTF
ncbi:hypothetical protein [Phaeobacter sp.]|uniref:hypothetical protein n=1 Tax=Phaeobacter sp. TaxID=1902409 RepID=UPI0025E12250|nr:hypothetical protein [Phaeobacter sp.]